jgi:uncharacterized protein
MSNVNFWNTLAVEDLERARAFYSALGFTVEDMPHGAGGITVRPNGSALICLFPTQTFAGMVAGQVCDATKVQEIIQSLSVDSREAVDALVAKAEKAGGRVLGRPKEAPFGYGGGFADPDGHVWSVLWMPNQP